MAALAAAPPSAPGDPPAPTSHTYRLQDRLRLFLLMKNGLRAGWTVNRIKEDWEGDSLFMRLPVTVHLSS